MTGRLSMGAEGGRRRKPCRGVITLEGSAPKKHDLSIGRTCRLPDLPGATRRRGGRAAPMRPRPRLSPEGDCLRWGSMGLSTSCRSLAHGRSVQSRSVGDPPNTSCSTWKPAILLARPERPRHCCARAVERLYRHQDGGPYAATVGGTADTIRHLRMAVGLVTGQGRSTVAKGVYAVHLGPMPPNW